MSDSNVNTLIFTGNLEDIALLDEAAFDASLTAGAKTELEALAKETQNETRRVQHYTGKSWCLPADLYCIGDGGLVTTTTAIELKSLVRDIQHVRTSGSCSGILTGVVQIPLPDKAPADKVIAWDVQAAKWLLQLQAGAAVFSMDDIRAVRQNLDAAYFPCLVN